MLIWLGAIVGGCLGFVLSVFHMRSTDREIKKIRDSADSFKRDTDAFIERYTLKKKG